MEPQTMEQMPKKKCVYDKERYEQNKAETFKYQNKAETFKYMRDTGQSIRRI